MSLNLQDPLLRLTGIHPRQTGGPLFCQILTDFARGGRWAYSTPGPARGKTDIKYGPISVFGQICIITYTSSELPGLECHGRIQRGDRGFCPPSIFQNIGVCNGKICWTTPGLKVVPPPPPRKEFSESTHECSISPYSTLFGIIVYLSYDCHQTWRLLNFQYMYKTRVREHI